MLNSPGLFSKPTKTRQELQCDFQDIAGNLEAIEQALELTISCLASAKEGGCVRRPSIMGPNPELARQYELQKEVLIGMRDEATKLAASKKPHA